jgi:hypothetical protein
MSANLCTESHLRELLEQGFEVTVVKDATAAAHTAEGDGYAAAVVNFQFLANHVLTTLAIKALLERLPGKRDDGPKPGHFRTSAFGVRSCQLVKAYRILTRTEETGVIAGRC